MDFLTLFVCYLLTSTAIILAYLAENSSFLKSGHIGRCRASVSKGLRWGSQKLPKPIWRKLSWLYDKLFCQKNAVFQLLYVAIVLGCHVVLVVDCLPYMYTVDSERNHVITPSVCFVVNAVLFVICCYGDAGVITRENLHRYLSIYVEDGVLYMPQTTCCTCHLPKPARSKHCAVSNRCYFKFDHYCVWTNNVVGGLNHRWFVMFLVSILIMCVNAIIMSVTSLVNVTSMYQLMTLHFLDASGLAQPMIFRVLIQTLFMQLPRLVIMVAALVVTSIPLLGFTLYHIYLILTNQTTNERYKRHHLRSFHQTRLLCHPYSRGLLLNLQEELFPLWEASVRRSNAGSVETAKPTSAINVGGGGGRATRRRR